MKTLALITLMLLGTSAALAAAPNLEQRRLLDQYTTALINCRDVERFGEERLKFCDLYLKLSDKLIHAGCHVHVARSNDWAC